MTPEELRALAADAAETINYAFDEPMVALSQADVLALANALDRYEPVTARAHECPRCHMKWIDAPKDIDVSRKAGVVSDG